MEKLLLGSLVFYTHVIAYIGKVNKKALFVRQYYYLHWIKRGAEFSMFFFFVLLALPLAGEDLHSISRNCKKL